MKRKLIISLLIILTTSTLLGVWIWKKLSPNADRVLHFIENNPNRFAAYMLLNDSVILAKAEQDIQPMAGLVQLPIAMEFARQCNIGRVSADSAILASVLDKFYLEGTDGGAHKVWKERAKEQGQIINDSVSLFAVNQGMIRFGSNACAEYLMGLLSLDSINAYLKEYGLHGHTPIYPFSSALYIPESIKGKLSRSELESAISAMPEKEYRQRSISHHGQLAVDVEGLKKESFKNPSLGLQELWSSRLPACSPKSYATTMSNILNDKLAILNSKQADSLRSVLEWVMERPGNKKWLRSCGMKGGATAYCVSKVFYAELKTGEKVVLCYVFNGLEPVESIELQMSQDLFDIALLKDPAFRKRVVEASNL